MDKAKTILVVGASQARRARSVAWLAPAGYALHERAAPDEVMPFVEAERPALVMLDFDPGDGAFDALCRTLKQRFPDTFILQIARKLEAGQSPTRVSCDDDPLNGDVDAFLVDPIDRIELVTLVRSLLRLQQVEVELRNSQDRWQLAQSSAGLAILDWTIPSDDFVHSPSFLELFDLAPGERALRAPDIVARIHHDDLPGLVADFAVQSRATGTFDREFRVVRRNGAVRWIDARGRFFANGAGEPERMLALSFDVTQRKNAEHANAVLAAVVASSSDAIISVDDAGAITSWNAGAERLFGLTAMEIVGQPLAVVLSDLPEEDREAYRQRITQGETQELETRQMRADGSLVDIWVTSAPLRSSGGQIIGASLFVRDMTAHRQREDHVRFLMRELTHRSKNLLAVIQAMARQSLTKGIAPDEFVRRFSERLAGLAGSHDLLSSVQYKGVSLVDLINSQLNHFEDCSVPASTSAAMISPSGRKRRKTSASPCTSCRRTPPNTVRCRTIPARWRSPGASAKVSRACST